MAQMRRAMAARGPHTNRVLHVPPVDVQRAAFLLDLVDVLDMHLDLADVPLRNLFGVQGLELRVSSGDKGMGLHHNRDEPV